MHPDTYLRGHPASFGGTSFESLTEAQKQCTIVPDCTGVTLGNSYTLRGGTSLLPSSTGESTWLKVSTDEECRAPEYFFDEAPLRNKCNNDCQCAGSRVCSNFGFCMENETFKNITRHDHYLINCPRLGEKTDLSVDECQIFTQSVSGNAFNIRNDGYCCAKKCDAGPILVRYRETGWSQFTVEEIAAKGFIDITPATGSAISCTHIDCRSNLTVHRCAEITTEWKGNAFNFGQYIESFDTSICCAKSCQDEVLIEPYTEGYRLYSSYNVDDFLDANDKVMAENCEVQEECEESSSDFVTGTLFCSCNQCTLKASVRKTSIGICEYCQEQDGCQAYVEPSVCINDVLFCSECGIDFTNKNGKCILDTESNVTAVDSANDSGGANIGMIIGIVVACLIVLIIGVGAAVFFLLNKRQKEAAESEINPQLKEWLNEGTVTLQSDEEYMQMKIANARPQSHEYEYAQPTKGEKQISSNGYVDANGEPENDFLDVIEEPYRA